MTAAHLALWLFVVILGIAFGAGLYEHRIAILRWITRADGVLHWDAASARRDDTGLRFWAYVSTGPLTILTLANLFFARCGGRDSTTFATCSSLAAGLPPSRR